MSALGAVGAVGDLAHHGCLKNARGGWSGAKPRLDLQPSSSIHMAHHVALAMPHGLQCTDLHSSSEKIKPPQGSSKRKISQVNGNLVVGPAEEMG